MLRNFVTYLYFINFTFFYISSAYYSGHNGVKVFVKLVLKIHTFVCGSNVENVYRTRAIKTRSWLLTVHKIRILWKKLLKKTFLAFKNGVKSIQTVGYNGARTVDKIIILSLKSKSRKVEFIQIALLGTRTIEDIQIL